jgi:hypothetical protein
LAPQPLQLVRLRGAQAKKADPAPPVSSETTRTDQYTPGVPSADILAERALVYKPLVPVRKQIAKFDEPSHA